MRQSNIEFRDDDDDDGSDGGLRNARGASLTRELQLHLPSDSYVYVYYCQSPWQIGTVLHSHIAWHHTRHISNHRSSVTLLTCFGRYWRASELHGFYLTYASKIPSDLT